MTTRFYLTASALAVLFPGAANGQTRLSERGTVGQTVDGTTITVDYARPQARGRSPIFGQMVHWGEVWTPGANWATNFTVSKDVKVNGQPLAEGSYSVWMVPQQETWTVFFHPTVHLFHTQRPSPDSAALRLSVTPRQGTPVEMLTFAFTDVARDRTTLEFRWEKAIIPLLVEVQSSRPVLALDRVPAYTGDWTVHSTNENGKVDTLAFTIQLKDGKLLGEVAAQSWIMELVPTRAPHTFMVGWIEKDLTVDVEADYPMVFTLEGDRATVFIVKSDNGDLWMRGVRAK